MNSGGTFVPADIEGNLEGKLFLWYFCAVCRICRVDRIQFAFRQHLILHCFHRGGTVKVGWQAERFHFQRVDHEMKVVRIDLVVPW